jgi:hypothetical protein
MRLSSPSSGGRDNDKNDSFELDHGSVARAGASRTFTFILSAKAL